MVIINHFWYLTVGAPAATAAFGWVAAAATTFGAAAVAVEISTGVNGTASQTVEAAQFEPRHDLSQPEGSLICHKTSTSP